MPEKSYTLSPTLNPFKLVIKPYISVLNSNLILGVSLGRMSLDNINFDFYKRCRLVLIKNLKLIFNLTHNL